MYSLGQNGLGADESRFHIVKVTGLYGKDILEGDNVRMDRYRWETIGDYVEYRRRKLCSEGAPDSFRIIFDTPLSLKYKGEFQHEFKEDAIKAGLIRRLWLLSCYEGFDGEDGDGWPPENDFPTMAETSCEEKEVSRYSSRSGRHMMLKGIRGDARLDGVTDDWLDVLLAGEITHIGKNTSFGFGSYHILKEG